MLSSQSYYLSPFKGLRQSQWHMMRRNDQMERRVQTSKEINIGVQGSTDVQQTCSQIKHLFGWVCGNIHSSVIFKYLVYNWHCGTNNLKWKWNVVAFYWPAFVCFTHMVIVLVLRLSCVYIQQQYCCCQNCDSRKSLCKMFTWLNCWQYPIEIPCMWLFEEMFKSPL